MDFQDAIRIASSGMSAQRFRLNMISSNLANANTTRAEGGGPYRRKDAVFQTMQVGNSFDQIMSEVEEEHMRGVRVQDVKQSDKFRSVFDPTHPDANNEGYVQMPDVNVVTEMVDMLQATRTYDANVQAVKALKAMAAQALQIG